MSRVTNAGRASSDMTADGETEDTIHRAQSNICLCLDGRL